MERTTLLLAQAADVDNYLGLPPLVRSVAIVVSLCMTFFVLWRSKTAKYWKDERDAAIAKAERLEAENKSKDAAAKERELELVTLRARTDLSQLQHINAEEHKAIVGTLKEIQIENARNSEKCEQSAAQRHQQMVQLITDQTRMAMGFQSQMASAFERITDKLITFEVRDGRDGVTGRDGRDTPRFHKGERGTGDLKRDDTA